MTELTPDHPARVAAKSAALAEWQRGSADTTQMLRCVNAALSAALPHLPGVLDRDKVVRAIRRRFPSYGWDRDYYVEAMTDAVMVLARTEAEVKAEAHREAADRTYDQGIAGWLRDRAARHEAGERP